MSEVKPEIDVEINAGNVHARLSLTEERLRVVEEKVAKAEAAFENFVKNAESNPVLRMALGKFGILSDDRSNG